MRTGHTGGEISFRRGKKDSMRNTIRSSEAHQRFMVVIFSTRDRVLCPSIHPFRACRVSRRVYDWSMRLLTSAKILAKKIGLSKGRWSGTGTGTGTGTGPDLVSRSSCHVWDSVGWGRSTEVYSRGKENGFQGSEDNEYIQAGRQAGR